MDHTGSNNPNLDVHKSNFHIDLKIKHSIQFDNTNPKLRSKQFLWNRN